MIQRQNITIVRPARATEALRVPCGSWWLEAPREGFTRVAQRHEPRMRARGVSSYSAQPEGAPVGRRGIGI